MRGWFRRMFFELGGKPQVAPDSIPIVTSQVRWTALIEDPSYTILVAMKEEEKLKAFITPQDAVDFKDELQGAYKLTGRTYMTDVHIKTMKS